MLKARGSNAIVSKKQWNTTIKGTEKGFYRERFNAKRTSELWSIETLRKGPCE
jgi:hypothetical protein